MFFDRLQRETAMAKLARSERLHKRAAYLTDNRWGSLMGAALRAARKGKSQVEMVFDFDKFVTADEMSPVIAKIIHAIDPRFEVRVLAHHGSNDWVHPNKVSVVLAWYVK